MPDITEDIATVRWYLDKRDDRAGWFALDRIEARIAELEEGLSVLSLRENEYVARIEELERGV